MADRIEAFEVTVPAGTTQAAPQETALPFNLGIVTDIEILVPPGPSGRVGFQIRHSGGSVVPYNPAAFVVADNEVIKWPVRNMPVGSAWGIRLYNVDVFPHTLYLRFLIEEVTRSGPVTIVPIPITQIAPAEIEPAPEIGIE
jgi:hypothetical protein